MNTVVSVTEFKAKCIALLNDVAEHGGTITVTKRGRPLANVGPANRPPWKSPEGTWSGKVKVLGDLLENNTSELWEVLHRHPGTRD
ncbi:MAG: type II toxin-antitoxin system prevent-host-death family antitoxin [Acidobacteriota bacterium]|nr:type II toxin-antitoxin system prevent-host-death family antitoxin [Acidobacteriota bacterium]